MGLGVKRFLGAAVPAVFVILLLASSLTHASATIVQVAGDSAVGKYSLAMPGSQVVLRDAFQKYVAVYVDAGGNLSITFANGDPTVQGAWSPPTKSPMPAVAYRRPAAVFTSPLSMRVIAEGGPAAGDLVDVLVTISRDLQGNIASVSYGSPTVLATSAQYPSAVPTHDAGIIVTWNSAVAGVASTVFSLRWNPASGWTSVADPLSHTPDIVIRDTANANNIQANVIERPDNFALLVIGNRGERSNDTTLVFNAAPFNGIGWVWGTQNLAYETDASRGLSDATDLAWDPLRSVVVVTYDISRTSRYGIIQIDSSGSKTHVDTPDLQLTNNEWGVLEVDPTNGDYYLFTMDTPLSPPWGQEFGNVTYTVRSNGVWSATLTLIDGGIDDMGISPLRPMFGTGGDGTREIVYAQGKTAPASLHFVRLTP